MVRKRKRVKTIFRKLFVPILCVMVCQSVLFYMTSVWGGVSETLKENAMEAVVNRVSERGLEFEQLYNESWSDMVSYAGMLNQIYEKYEKRSEVPIYESQALQEEYLEDVSGILISLLRNTPVNGVFLIMNNTEEYHVVTEDPKREKAGICIRDYDLEEDVSDDSDLQVLRCPSQALATLGFDREEAWEDRYSFSEERDSDYYYRPLYMAYNNANRNQEYMAYFSGKHTLGGSEEVVSYSVPLVSAEGRPYGVLGVEISSRKLSSMLPSYELGVEGGSYAIVKYDTFGNECSILAYDGEFLEEKHDMEKSLPADFLAEEGFFSTTTDRGEVVCGSVSGLVSYNSGSNPYGEKIALAGFVSEDSVFAFQRQVVSSLLIAALSSMVVGVGAIYLISRRFTRPIVELSRKVKTISPTPDFKLEKLGIVEIDQLVTAIEELGVNISDGKARAEFFSRMSHDMRTPMNAILSFSSGQMLEGASEADKDEYLAKIHSSANYLLGIINEILDLNKMESGKMELFEECISLDETWNVALTITQTLARSKGVEFYVDLPEGELPWISCDGQRLGQIIVNLLSNAVKFTDPGGWVKFTCILLDVNEEEVRYCFTVKDNGIGMSEEFQAKVYEPFVQGNTKQEGTGLGLAITRQLVELMGGTLECISRQGEGTEFFVYLQSPKCDPPSPRVEERSDSREKGRELEGIRILLCEDHTVNRHIAKRLLENRGILVDMAADGKAGCEAFAVSEPGYYDGILMDIRMPVMDGMEATAAIRGMDREDGRTIPIIAMTANVLENDVQEARDAGMNAHLSKPIDPASLYQTLEELCGRTGKREWNGENKE